MNNLTLYRAARAGALVADALAALDVLDALVADARAKATGAA